MFQADVEPPRARCRFLVGWWSNTPSGFVRATVCGGHLASETQNTYSLGICLVGNFDLHAPSPKQMESLRALVETLLARCKLPPSAVKTHQQINVVHTRCPGTKFPAQSFLESLKSSAAPKARK